MLKNPKIIAEINDWRKKKASEISKEDLIDRVMQDYDSVEVTEANRPRFVEIAGKLLGYLGTQPESRPNQTLNLTQINVTGAETQAQLWELTRKLLANE